MYSTDRLREKVEKKKYLQNAGCKEMQQTPDNLATKLKTRKCVKDTQ